VVQQAQGIENFFDALFSFMRRKTDFFTQKQVCHNMVTKMLDKHLAEFE